MPNERTLYLHVGTHKTGTTSLQAFVTLNEAALASKGIFVPVAGRPIRRFGSSNVGHHNVAWELNDIPMFDPVDGTFAQLLAEIERSSAPTVLLSSEDFEWLHAKPAVLQMLQERFAALGYTTKVLLYLRAQAEYAQAIYIEGSKAGMLIDYAAYWAEILDRGTYVPDPRVVNRFEYGPLVDGFAGAFGAERVVVRPYRTGADPDLLLREFLALIGAGDLPFETLLKPASLNVSPSIFQVLFGMYATVKARDASAPDPNALVRAHFPGEDGRVFLKKFDATPEADIRRALDRFRDDNRRIEDRYGARVPFQSETDLRPRDAAAWEGVRKHRQLLDAAITAWGI
jgi:hypothetical protein